MSYFRIVTELLIPQRFKPLLICRLSLAVELHILNSTLMFVHLTLYIGEGGISKGAFRRAVHGSHRLAACCELMRTSCLAVSQGIYSVSRTTVVLKERGVWGICDVYKYTPCPAVYKSNCTLFSMFFSPIESDCICV